MGNRPSVTVAADPFLPSGTFVAELAAFVLIVLVLARWAAAPINRALTDRQETIRARFAELDQALARARQAEHAHRVALTAARDQAERIRARARADRDTILADHQTRAKVEATRILDAARAQAASETQQAAAQLRGHLARQSTDLAGQILAAAMQDPTRQHDLLDRVLHELEPDTPTPEHTGSSTPTHDTRYHPVADTPNR